MNAELNHRKWTLQQIGMILVYLILLVVVPLLIFNYVNAQREHACITFATGVSAKYFYSRKQGMCIVVFENKPYQTPNLYQNK